MCRTLSYRGIPQAGEYTVTEPRDGRDGSIR